MIDQVPSFLTSVESKAKSFLEGQPALNGPITEMATKVNQPAERVLLGLVSVALLLLTSLISKSFVITLVAFAYPLIASAKAVELKNAEDEKTFWLSYWVVLGVVLFVFRFIDRITDNYFFFLIKLAIIVWMFFPSTRGATVVFDLVAKQICSHCNASKADEPKSN